MGKQISFALSIKPLSSTLGDNFKQLQYFHSKIKIRYIHWKHLKNTWENCSLVMRKGSTFDLFNKYSNIIKYEVKHETKSDRVKEILLQK